MKGLNYMEKTKSSGLPTMPSGSAVKIPITVIGRFLMMNCTTTLVLKSPIVTKAQS